MSVKFKKDMVLFTKYLRRLAVKYPKAYITGSTQYNMTSADVKCYEDAPKSYDGFNYSHYRIGETGKMEFTE